MNKIDSIVLAGRLAGYMEKAGEIIVSDTCALTDLILSEYEVYADAVEAYYANNQCDSYDEHRECPAWDEWISDALIREFIRGGLK